MWLRNRSTKPVCSKKSTAIESVPSDKPIRRLLDIVENAAAIDAYTRDLGVQEALKDQKTRDAVERCLERISEAASKLGDLAAVWIPDQPWPQIRALGNRLRHDYDGIDHATLRGIVAQDVPPLAAACKRYLDNPMP